MSKVGPTYDDEINLFEFFERLWDGKWLIGAFLMLAASMGFFYSQVAQSKYDISVPYRVNVYSVFSQQMCESNNQNQKDWRASHCFAERTVEVFLEGLGSDWSLNRKGKVISRTTTSPSPTNEYEAHFSKALISTNKALKIEAISELTTIESLSNDGVLATERVATNLLNAKRIIQSLDSGQNAISFGPISVVKSSPKSSLIIAFAAILGVIVGVFLIIIRDGLKKRNEKLVKL